MMRNHMAGRKEERRIGFSVGVNAPRLEVEFVS